MENEFEVLMVDCRLCKRRTRHEILCQHAFETDPEEYHERDTWQIVRCLGCHSTGFRHRNDDFEQVRETSDGRVIHEVITNIYPRFLRNHIGLRWINYVPDLIRNVYRQTLAAYGEKAFVLASIGLRATIEAVCNHLHISGNNLEKRIDQLFKAGYVSNADKKRLHAIRFLGNDAAHDVKEPKESELRVALEIVEHLLNSVFILERKSASLETVIDSYDDFLKLLGSCIKGIDDRTQAISLGALLGTKRRLVGNNTDGYEAQMQQDIQVGKITLLNMAQIENVSGRNVQLYVVVEDGAPKDSNTDDLI